MKGILYIVLPMQETKQKKIELSDNRKQHSYNSTGALRERRDLEA